jgi:hypothetical protein
MKKYRSAAAYFIPPQWAVATLAVVILFAAMYTLRMDGP